MNAQIFEIGEPKNWSIPEIYEQVARDVGYPTTSMTKFDCRKILVSEDIQEKVFDFLRSSGSDEASIGMMWCFAGPKTEKQLPKGHVCIMDGFFVEELSFDGIEHIDVFEGEFLFWVNLSNPSKEIQEKAKEIDGENYEPGKFGLCAIYDRARKEYDLITDTDPVDSTSRNIFYIDDAGDKHWFTAEIPDDFLKEVYKACSAAEIPLDVRSILNNASVSVLENITSCFIQEVNEDDEPFDKVGQSMLEAYSCNDVNAFCVAVTGWTFKDILKKAGAIEDYDHTFEG